MRVLLLPAPPAWHPPCLAGMSGWHTHGLLGLPAATATRGKGGRDVAAKLGARNCPSLGRLSPTPSGSPPWDPAAWATEAAVWHPRRVSAVPPASRQAQRATPRVGAEC